MFWVILNTVGTARYTILYLVSRGFKLYQCNLTKTKNKFKNLCPRLWLKTENDDT